MKYYNLLNWLERRNGLAKIFGNHSEWTLEDCKLEEVYRKIFCSLDNELSPENLCCDGELRGRRLEKKAFHLKMTWSDLEMLVGISVPYNSHELDRWHGYLDG